MTTQAALLASQRLGLLLDGSECRTSEKSGCASFLFRALKWSSLESEEFE
jgi:hypothetical protein